MNGLVAIVGRTNVGKSTLFNRFLKKNSAITEDVSGVTRDRNTGTCDWNGYSFLVMDTGGYEHNPTDIIAKSVGEQVIVSLSEADIVLFIVDRSAGITPDDLDISHLLRKHCFDKVLLIINKTDNFNKTANEYEFSNLGFDPIYSISALTGSGTGDLLDVIISKLPKDFDNVVPNSVPRLAIVGRPNVGKSSLLNALLAKETTIVTSIPGTTRDSICSRYNSFGFEFDLIDTAGLRRKAKVNEDVEYFSNVRSVRSILDCDIALLVIDCSLGLHAQDLHIFRLINQNRKGCIIVANKADLFVTLPYGKTEFLNTIQSKLAPQLGVPVIFTSAINKTNIFHIMEMASNMVLENANRISTRQLNDTILPIIKKTPPPTTKGKRIKIKFISQVPAATPTFLFFSNRPKDIPVSYRRFLEKQLRILRPYTGWPIAISFRLQK